MQPRLWTILTSLIFVTGVAMELMKQGAMLTVLSTLFAALAWPAALLSVTDFIDSKWTIALDRFACHLTVEGQKAKTEEGKETALCLSLISSILEWGWC